MRGALLGSLIGAGADVLGGLGIDQCLEHQGEPLADQVEVPAGTQCIQQVGQGRLAEGHRGELLGVNLGRITLSFTRWPSPCYPAGQGLPQSPPLPGTLTASLSKPLRETALQEALTAARAIAKEESRAQA